MKSKLIFLITLCFGAFVSYSQNTIIAPGSVLPQMTSAQRTTLSNPVNGMLVFDTTTNSYWFRQNAAWVELPKGGSTSNYWQLSGLAGNELKNTNSGGFWSANPTIAIEIPSVSGPAPVEGNGTRLMWIPSSSAFRVGTVHQNSGAWDTDSIGLASTAFGINAVAKGYNSFVTGLNNKVYGSQSAAFGVNNKVSGYSSSVVGASNNVVCNSCLVSGELAETLDGTAFAVGGGFGTESGPVRRNIFSVNKNNRVGINLTNPLATLDLSGVPEFGSPVGNYFEAQLRISRKNNSHYFQMGFEDGFNHFKIQNTSPIGQIHLLGKIGINTENALAGLHISKSSEDWDSHIRLQHDNISLGQIKVDSEGLKFKASSTGKHFKFYNFLNENTATLYSTGNFFVSQNIGAAGVLNPVAPVHIGNGPDTWERHIRLDYDESTNEYGNIVYDDQGMKFRAWGTGDNVYFRNNVNTQIATIFSTGNMTIAGTLTQNSDSRLKTNCIKVQNSRTKLAQLQAYNYNWKATDSDPSLQTGLIAQEVQKQFPELVSEGENGYLSVNYIGLIPHLIESQKELNAENEALKARLLSIEKKLETLNQGQMASLR